MKNMIDFSLVKSRRVALHLHRHRPDTSHGEQTWLDARHRSHARIEDRIHCGKDTGLGRFPSKLFAINQAGWPAPCPRSPVLAWSHTTLVHENRALA
ncbi:MAG: hypothetical protein ABI384_01045 [Allobranchiibius sp.]